MKVAAAQTRTGSMIEVGVNITIGYLVALGAQLVIFPLVGIVVDLSTNVVIGCWFTLVSVVRSYLVRRFFNARLRAAVQRIER